MSQISNGTLQFTDLLPPADDFEAEVLSGLAQSQKVLPAKFFYDAKGAALFEQICELPEYYPTRTELAIMRAHVGDIAAFLGADCHLIEYGSGAGIKIRLLLEALRPALYMPIDISVSQLRQVGTVLQQSYPWLNVHGVAADYTKQLALPVAPSQRRAVFFPGSTVGNFTLDETRQFLRSARALVGTGGALLIGVDTKKDKATLDAAYDDAAGVTALFNLNILHHINARTGAQIDIGAFEHWAFYSPERGQIEMHLRARHALTVDVLGRSFSMQAGETIHTEISRKYAPVEFAALGAECGWQSSHIWQDAAGMFSVHGLTAL